MISLLGLDPATHRRHALHGEDRSYTETNCWTDVMIEFVAAHGLEPEAMLGSLVTVDLELDQWTFFKPPPEDLRVLYGIDVHEMQPYRGLAGQIEERLVIGQTLIPELDAYFLPDTATTSYHREHVKTSVVVEAIDVDAQVLRYFHNAGYFELSGEDFGAVLDPGWGPHSPLLPPYVELVRFDRDAAPSGDERRAVARDLLAGHLRRRPEDNPFVRFRARLEADLPGLLEGDLAAFHAHAFANARMAGAAFELLASHVRWLLGPDGDEIAAALEEIVSGTKVLLFRLARRRAFDVGGVVGPMALGWEQATGLLDDLLSSGRSLTVGS